MKHLKLLIYDVKEMGYGFFLTPVMLLLLISYTIMINDESVTLGIMDMHQHFVGPLAAWWVVMSFYSYTDEDGGEAFLSYPFSRRYIGMGRTLIFVSCFLVLVFLDISILYVSGVCNDSTMFAMCALVSGQAFFYGSFGFFLVVRLNSVLWALAMVLAIAFVNIWGIVPKLEAYITVTIVPKTAFQS